MAIFSIFNRSQDQDYSSVRSENEDTSRSSAATIAGITADSYQEALEKIYQVFNQSCNGDLEPRILNIDHPDELVTKSFNVLNAFLDQTDAFVRESTATMENACNKKYYRRFLHRGFGGLFREGATTIDHARQTMSDIYEQHQEKTRNHTSNFEEKISVVVQSLSGAVENLGGTSDSMVVMAENTHQQTEEVVGATRQSADNVGAVASATEELSGSINAITAQMNDSSQVIRETVEGAEKAGDAVGGLEKSANEIDNVVELIRSIAGQTNLLALNATIEAARAGDAGRGFAIVASEVKNLAAETSRATADIVAQVHNIQGATRVTVDVIREIQQKISQVDQFSSSITETINEQNTATVEISSNIQQAAGGTSLISGNIDKISTAAEGTSRMAIEVGENTTVIKQQISNIEQAVENFLVAIRTG